ncbi:ATP/GTP-binding protein [Streptomyces armeniacus]|uniref:ATP/GTP-binding protein n=1 Tax=Streptomyces armeniacus TaxID=83291 RepID=A0A345XXY4_9ACTN|nr:ATP/GTP-binding protein [Streptomyces armeniacus]AXK36500.1 ATP/GTP-binding protein [Streptomyces armeniacus]
MAGRDLRALFHSNDRELEVSEAFTNRLAQWHAVAAALTAHAQHLSSPGFDVEDLESGRRNVLVFHGVGGIGKSTLSRKLEAALGGQRPAQWGELPFPTEHLLPVRIDLARAAGIDFERVVLAIRLALAGLGRPMPAFDLALRRHWEHHHPGEPLEDYLQRGGMLARFSGALNLPQQMQSALADAAQALALPGTVGGAIGQIAQSLVSALRERRQTVRALAGCSRLADVLDAEPDLETLSFATHLLAWDLAQLPPDRAVLPVVLFDAFEDTGDRTHRDLERLLQRIVWLMPNAFFVITGRNRLQWADTGLHGQLDWAGPAAWPELVPHEAPGPQSAVRQVLIGDFSPQDCEDYLARRLADSGGRPLIGGPLRRTIAARSGGLPLYLDLSIMRFLEIRRSRQPEAEDFGDFPALIARTLSDLTPGERHVLRSVSLLDAFSVSLAARAAGLDQEAAALRLSERPFVRHDQDLLWPFHLHQVVRSAIRNADDHTDDRWSPADWRRAAERAFDALGSEWHSCPRDRAVLVACLRQGLALARDFSLELGWLTDAAFQYVGDSVWEPLTPAARTIPGRAPRTAADTLVETLSALARRQHEHRERTAERLAAVTTTGLLPAELEEMALYYLAKAQRDLGRTAESRRGMQQIAARGGRLAPAAKRGLAHLSRLAGDFPTAMDTARTLGWEGRHHRVTGDVWWLHARMDEAADAYEAGRLEAEQHGKAGEAATTQALRAFALAFADPDQADDALDLAAELLARVDLRATTINAQLAALVRDAGHPGVEDRARHLRTEISTAGLASVHATLELVLCFHHAVLDNQTELAAALARLRELTRGGDYAYYTDIAHFMAALPVEPSTRARWLDGEDPTRRRWRALVNNRRQHLRRTEP